MILPHPDHFADAVRSSTTKRPSGTHPARPAATRSPSDERNELAALVGRAQAGETAAQNELVRRYNRRISGHVRMIIRQPEAVEDVVQTIFIKMFRRFGRLRDPGSFESWLFRLSRNTSLDFIRRRRCRPVTIPAEGDFYEIPDPGDVTATSEILEALEAALVHLSPKDRALVTLFVAGNSYRSLAARQGLTMGAVKARLHRMRPFLRAFVGGATETRLAGADRWGPTASAHLAA